MTQASRMLGRLVPLVVLAAAACSRKLETPAPSLGAAGPQVVCSEQLVTAIDVAGSNLVPLPTRTIDGEKEPALRLPSFELVPASALDGTALAGTPVRIADDADAAAQSRVRWASESSMSFDIHPGLATPGVYSLRTTNPDGRQTTLANALALVPPPTVSAIVPAAICDAQGDRVVELRGTGFLGVGDALPSIELTPPGGEKKTYTPTETDGCADIAAAVRAGVRSCASLVFVVKKDDFAAGEVGVRVVNPAPAACSSTETMKLVVNPPPALADVMPATICQGGGTLTLNGTGLQQGASVTLTAGASSVAATSVTVPDGQHATALFESGGAMFVPGTKYDVTLSNPDSCSAALPQAVTAVAGPVMLFVDPPIVYNGIATQVTVYATAVTAPLGEVKLKAAAGGDAITLADARIDPNHPKRILMTIPRGLAAGNWGLTVTDATGCPASLAGGLQVVAEANLTLTKLDPSFGWKSGSTAITLDAAGGLQPTPRVYASPHVPTATSVAAPLLAATWVSATRLTAIVPAGLDPAAGPYDIIVVNPDGNVGVLNNGFSAKDLKPPVVDTISPGAVSNTAPAAITISGANFRQPEVSFICVTDLLTGATQEFAATTSNVSETSIRIATPPVSTLAAPTLCRIQVKNGDDQSFATFSALAISNSSGNLSAPKNATALPEARRAPAVLGAAATRAARFLYAVGGDTGAAAGALDTVVTTTADENGTGATWFAQRYKLSRPRTLAGSASLGRYLYVVGGNDGAGPVKTVERAKVLDPLDAPTIAEVDVIPDAAGLGQGFYSYRVAAVMAANDADNPGGETLPSEAQPMQLPDLGAQKLQVKLSWTSVPGAAGYIVYRASGAEVPQAVAEVQGGLATTWTDNGAAPLAGRPAPLQLGSTGKWRLLAELGTARESPGVAFGFHASAPNRQFLYATLGRSAAGALGTCEFLPVTVESGAAQTPAAGWTAATVTTTARYQHSIYSVTNENASFIPAGDSYIYLGGGTANGTQAVQSLDYAKIAADGQLGAFTASGTTIKSYGHGAVAAANYLYGFAGNGASASIKAGQVDQAAPPKIVNYNNNGAGLAVGRYLPGVALIGALIYVVGGSDVADAPSTSVETLVW